MLNYLVRIVRVEELAIRKILTCSPVIALGNVLIDARDKSS